MKHLEKVITKELLRKVLPKETENLSDDFSFYIDEDYIVFSDEGEQLFDYNIYKFAFKCKEWALDKGYEIYSSDIFAGIGLRGGDGYGVYWDYEFYEGTEIEANIKACIWISKFEGI